MKKVLRIVLASVLITVSAFAFTACGAKTARAEGIAIGKGHGNPATVIEVKVIADGNGGVVKVQFEEIMPINYAQGAVGVVGSVDKATGEDDPKKTAANANITAVTLYATAAKEASGTTAATPDKDWTRYAGAIVINGVVFTAQKTDNNLFKGYAGTLNGTAITDLATYCGGDGYEWYYNAVTSNKAFYGKLTDGAWTASTIPLRTDYGSIRKRQSTYWSANASGGIGQWSGLGIKGNWEELENYLLVHGFDAIGTDGAIKNPKDTADKLFVEINGVSTGATLSADAGLYLSVAKAAYEKAMENLG